MSFNLDINRIERNISSAAGLLKSLSNEKRLFIVCILFRGEKSVGQLEEVIGLSQSALSQHLAKLRRDDIVSTRRDAQTIYYSLKNDATIKVLGALDKIYCSD